MICAHLGRQPAQAEHRLCLRLRLRRGGGGGSATPLDEMKSQKRHSKLEQAREQAQASKNEQESHLGRLSRTARQTPRRSKELHRHRHCRPLLLRRSRQLPRLRACSARPPTAASTARARRFSTAPPAQRSASLPRPALR